MTEKRANPKSTSAKKSGQEHERLLLDAAQLLPQIILEEVMPADSIRQRTLDYSEQLDMSERVEKLIADGKIKGAAQQALWRNALLDPPGVKLDPAVVSFGHSFFVETNSSRATRPKEIKRLGMVDLCVDWKHPAQGRLRFNPEAGNQGSVKLARDLYKLNIVTMRLFAVAFPSDVPLGKIMSCTEDLKDWIRLDAQRRFAEMAPLMIITGREAVFDAISVTNDALLIEGQTYVADLGYTRDVADSLNRSHDPKF